MKIRPMVAGLVSYIPYAYDLLRKGTGGTLSARYCYSVWLRHLITNFDHSGMRALPRVLAELGPGDSLGIGMAALVSGVEKYYALDVVAYANTARNVEIVEELVKLFRARAEIPGTDEFPDIMPRLDSSGFPTHILSDKDLEAALKPRRVERILADLMRVGTEESEGIVSYVVPWNDQRIIQESSVDLIVSQAVLEHVEDLDATYKAMYRWLKPGGVMSHAVDFRSHGITDEWNGHWGISQPMWRIIKGKRPYFLNREPRSTHAHLLEEHGFILLAELDQRGSSGIPKANLAKEFCNFSDSDVTTQAAVFVAKKTK